MKKNNYKKIYINARFLTQSITGVQRYAIEFVKALDKLVSEQYAPVMKYQFELLAPKNNHIHHLNLKNIPLRLIGSLSGYSWEQFQLPKYVKEGILFCPGNTAPLFTLFSKIPVVVTVHDLSYKYFPSAYNIFFRIFYHLMMPLIFKYATSIITVSNAEKKSILKYYAKVADKVYVVQNGSISGEQLNTISDVGKKDLKKPYILYVGSLNKRKNPHGLLNAFSILSNRDINLIIAGSDAKFLSSCSINKSLITNNKILFKGQINDSSELFILYKNAACLVFPSFYEASPLPPIEAMTCGCPVVASDIPSLKERCGNAAIYCDPNNAHDIANKVLKILENKKLQADMRSKGYEQAKKYTWDQCVINTISIFDKI